MAQLTPPPRVLLAVRLGDDSAANTEICSKLAELMRRTYPDPSQLRVEAGKGNLTVSYDDQRLTLSDLMQVAARARLRLAII